MDFFKSHIWSFLVAANYVLAVTLIFVILFKQLNPTKTISYILVLLLVPFLGLVVYVLFGQDYRKSKLFNRKNILDQRVVQNILNELILDEDEQDIVEELLQEKSKLYKLIYNNEKSKLTTYNQLQILINGEEKFKVFIQDLLNAKHHIHMEYYILEDDRIGNEIIDVLCKKAQDGVEVKLVYDDVGSSISIKNRKKLSDAGVLHYPFMPVLFSSLTGKMNYRNHRKILIVDGEIGYLGGVNIADHYVNDGTSEYWRDTHLRIAGDAVKPMQILFFTTWDFVQDKPVKISERYFPIGKPKHRAGVQIVSSGPDTDWPNIMEAIFAAIMAARSYIYITTPYFIPNDEILAALQTATRSGVDVQLLIPKKSDSWISGSATNSYLKTILDAGVKVYLYKKGFIHAKTMVLDDEISSIGTANMDYRSFDINFEVNAFIYDKETSIQLKEQFQKDLMDADHLKLADWEDRPIINKFVESVSKLLAPLL